RASGARLAGSPDASGIARGPGARAASGLIAVGNRAVWITAGAFAPAVRISEKGLSPSSALHLPEQMDDRRLDRVHRARRPVEVDPDAAAAFASLVAEAAPVFTFDDRDRKSTRLNSSHVTISYA